jgi:hypothetical protein
MAIKKSVEENLRPGRFAADLDTLNTIRQLTWAQV